MSKNFFKSFSIIVFIVLLSEPSLATKNILVSGKVVRIEPLYFVIQQDNLSQLKVHRKYVKNYQRVIRNQWLNDIPLPAAKFLKQLKKAKDEKAKNKKAIPVIN